MAEFYGHANLENHLVSREGTIKGAKRFSASESSYGSPGLELTVEYDGKEIKWQLYGHAYYGELLDQLNVDDINGLNGLEGKVIQVAVDSEGKAKGIKPKEN